MKPTIHSILVTILVLIGLPERVSANKFKMINSGDGLPGNTITSIVQDANGYLWFGTSNGLCRYDGVSFTTYRNDPSDNQSLAANIIVDIQADSKGIFMAMNYGIDYYSFEDGTFHHCQKLVAGKHKAINKAILSMTTLDGRLFYADSDGSLYANSAKDKLTFQHIPQQVKIYSLCAADGYLLAAGDKGIYTLTPDGKSIKSRLQLHPGSIAKLNISYIKQTKTVYVGCGLGFSSSVYRLNDSKLKQIKGYVPANLMDAVWYNGRTVFATDGHGIIVLDNKGRTKAYTTANSNIGGDVAYALHADNSGDLWIGTYRAGLAHHIGGSSPFTLIGTTTGGLTFDIVTAITPVGDKIYVGLDGGGLNIYEQKSGLVRAFNTHNSELPGDNVVSMAYDGADLWMAVYTKGLVRYSPQKKSFDLWPMPESNKTGELNNVWCLCDDGLGNIWVGGPRLYIFNKHSQTFTTVKGIDDIKCSSIQISGKYVWISSNINGIYKIDKSTKKIIAHYTASGHESKLPANNIKYIHIDKNGRLWFTIENVGLYSMDTATGKTKAYNADNGLTLPLVVSIAEDDMGRMWMGTDGGGLFCYNTASETFMRYDGQTGIPLIFTYSATATHNQAVYMGTIGGMLCFKPSEVGHLRLTTNVSFNNLSLMGNKKHTFNLYGMKDASVRLAHNQNFFTVSFSVPELHSPGSLRFSCRLDGLESSWRDLSDMREVSYTNVPPGRYKLYVRSTEANGRWSKPSVLAITILPPWWKTTWAIILWTILAISAIIGGIMIWGNEQKVKQRMRISEIEKDATKRLSEAKLNFYANITHELRTPVFLIMAQLEELINIRHSVVNVPSTYLKMMYRSAIKLNKLITSVIDFRKMDSDKLTLQPRQGDLIAFCDNLIDDYTELCSQKDITFTFIHEAKSIPLSFDQERLDIILSNLVSNAYKYTKEGGHVERIVEDLADHVAITVKDNGIGILKEMQTDIFKDFFRTERGKLQSGGDGMGLSFVKQLVELHGGTIRVESEPEEGSEFIFTLPKNISRATASASTAIAHTPQTNKPTPQQEPTASQTETSQTQIRRAETANPTALHSILIIDDERDTVSLLERNLSADFKIYKAYDGSEGLDVARQYLPDIVLCDLMMPKMDGMQVLEAIRNDKKLQHMKVIMFTAESSEENMIKAYDNGADAYVTKPISLKYLRTRIDHLIEQTDTANTTGTMQPGKKIYNKEEQVFLLRCREIIDDNLANEAFNIDFMADKLAMSHSALYKKIKTMTGMSLIEFINEYKVYKAILAFKQGATSVEKVAAQCGFKDIKNFRQAFKRKTGTTPKQFIKSL